MKNGYLILKLDSQYEIEFNISIVERYGFFDKLLY